MRGPISSPRRLPIGPVMGRRFRGGDDKNRPNR